MDIIKLAKETIIQEAESIKNLANFIDLDFEKVVQMSGPSKYFVKLMFKFIKIGIKKSKFHNKYPIPYESAMKEMMDDYDFLYGSMIKDQYNLGRVLSRKYKLLTYSYNFFMFSFVIAVIAFFILYLRSI